VLGQEGAHASAERGRAIGVARLAPLDDEASATLLHVPDLPAEHLAGAEVAVEAHHDCQGTLVAAGAELGGPWPTNAALVIPHKARQRRP
jgi:hypothetical protein